MSDQTKPEWMKGPEQALGTGIYASGSVAVPVFVYVPGTTIARFRRDIAKVDPIAFQWVPHSIASEDAVRAADCGLWPCNEADGCVMPGCVCIDGRCTQGV